MVSAALAELLNKYERTPELVAELLRYSVATWDDARLVRRGWAAGRQFWGRGGRQGERGVGLRRGK